MIQMEEIETKEVKTKQIIHKFYCDECQKHIGDSYEYDDGYYDELGNDISMIFCYKSAWFKLKRRCYCDDCYKPKEKELLEKLREIGFEKE